MTNSVAEGSILYRPDMGAGRAYELGPSRNERAIALEFLWMPEMHLSAGVTVETDHGWTRVSDLKAMDWLKIRIPEGPGNPEPSDRSGPAYEIYPHMMGLLNTDGMRMTDMMCCPDYLAHWRSDLISVSVRQCERYFWDMVYRDNDFWWHRILEVNSVFSPMVAIEGPWEVYGFRMMT